MCEMSGTSLKMLATPRVMLAATHFTLQEGGGALKAPPPEQKWQFKHLLVIQLS